MKRPDILYKYYSLDKKADNNGFSSCEGVKRLIKNNEVYFSRANELNDPFEAKTNYVIEPESLIALLKKDYPEKSNSEIEKGVEGFFENGENLDQEKRMREEINTRSNKFGIFCMTSIPDSILMWSHYAHGHNGICVGFDLSGKSSESKIFSESCKEVNYSKKYPIISPNINIRNEGKKIFYTKYLDWEYEHEWRIVIEEYLGRITLPNNLIKCIILGDKIEPDYNKEEVISWILEKDYVPEIKIARTDKEKFKIIIEEYRKHEKHGPGP